MIAIILSFLIVLLQEYMSFANMISKDFSSLNMQGDMSQRSTSQGGISRTEGRVKTQNDRVSRQFESLAGGHIIFTLMLLILSRQEIVYFMIAGYFILMAVLFLKSKVLSYISYQMKSYHLYKENAV